MEPVHRYLTGRMEPVHRYLTGRMEPVHHYLTGRIVHRLTRCWLSLYLIKQLREPQTELLGV